MITLIDDHRQVYGVELICKVLPIAPSTYQAHVAKRADPAKLSVRTRQDMTLKPEIARIFAENFEVYGVRKVWRQMMRERFDVARCTVERLMRSMGLAGAIRGKPRPIRGGKLIHHSDRGSQYISIRYTKCLAEAGIEPSVGSVEDSYDNALAETINGLYKAKAMHRCGQWRSFEAVEFATLEWVDWFNNRRLLALIGNIPPAEAEERYYSMLNEQKLAA